jgi:hypothetical protein
VFGKSKRSEETAYKVSQAELNALFDKRNPLIHGGVDHFYKWRHAFLCLAGVVISLRLGLYSEQAVPLTSFLHLLGIDSFKYMGFRVGYVVITFALYVFSYLRDWFFPQVAMLVFALALGSLITDGLSFYVFYQNGLPFYALAFLAVRVLVVVTLFYNAMNVHRAPAMPRHFFS